MKTGKFVAVIVEGTRDVHAAAGMAGVYATLCGLDGDDPNVSGQMPDAVKRGERITCAQCKSVWEAARRYQKSDFIV